MRTMTGRFLAFALTGGALAASSDSMAWPVSIREYAVPTPDARPHDPATGKDGALWFTAQQANVVGRLDPATGAVVLQPMVRPGSNPYGLVVTKEGIPFVCEFGTNKIARVDPDTLAIREYVLPDGARPRRLAVASDG